jgi:sialate O-acetylesterase
LFDDWSNGQNGSYWFRTIANVPSELAGQPARLRFGAMKDADSIFVNGKCIGNTTYEYPPRNYNVPAGLLRAGENNIVVHLISQNGQPHFTKGKRYQLEVGEHIIPFGETLQMAVGCKRPERPRCTYFVDCPAALYNAMIAPLRQFPFRGVVWYQGESNIETPHHYADYLTALASSWRQQFFPSVRRRRNGRDLPFVIVQLPTFMDFPTASLETGWAQIRHEQYLASQRIPKSAPVSIIDTGEAYDIHPQDKHIVGHRVAQQMSRLVY